MSRTPSLTSQQQQAVRLFRKGYPVDDIARTVSTTTSEIDRWLRTNPDFARAVAYGISVDGSYQDQGQVLGANNPLMPTDLDTDSTASQTVRQFQRAWFWPSLQAVLGGAVWIWASKWFPEARMWMQVFALSCILSAVVSAVITQLWTNTSNLGQAGVFFAIRLPTYLARIAFVVILVPVWVALMGLRDGWRDATEG